MQHPPSFVRGLHYETLQPIEVVIVDGWIDAIREIIPDPGKESLSIIAPGLIDNQINGFAGVDYCGDQLTVDEIIRSVKAMWKSGVTTFLPTLITNSTENLERNFRILAAAMSSEAVGSSVPGFHLEGPFLSSEDGYRGCHPVEHTRLPEIALLERLQAAAAGRIVQLTLAPELEGSCEMIYYCSDNGILTAIGHSAANRFEIRRAIEHGVRLSTHLGNGCANLIHRHENPIWPQLADERIIPTIIADGHHLLPEELIVFLKCKGADKIILTSDITYLAGMPAGRYFFGGSEVILHENGLLQNAQQNCLAGASLPLMTGVSNMIKYTGCSLAEAINMASGNVARVFGWNHLGKLMPGCRADLIFLRQSVDGPQLIGSMKNGTHLL